MMSSQSNLDYVISLYNGHSAIAERVDFARLDQIHIPTPLDAKVEEWVAQKHDVVLTGNPGDGKTHLMNILDTQSRLLNAYLEKDASQKTARHILESWAENKRVGKPFVLAINHAPLRQLAEQAKDIPDLSYLNEKLPASVDNFVVYHTEGQEDLGPPMIIDLSQRELLDDQGEITNRLLDTLCVLAISEECPHCPPPHCEHCPVTYNVEALSNKKIRNHLLKVLSLVAKRGFHATMRDLIGLLAYIITGGVSCAERWKPVINDDGEEEIPKCDDYFYYNLLFMGRNKLFDAIRNTFDPGDYADSKVDIDLWMGKLKTGWLINKPDPVSPRPGTLEELRRLKRRYFFEYDHEDVDRVINRVLSETERDFYKLISEDEAYDHQHIEDLIEMINLLYAPLRPEVEQGQGYRYRLRLWNKHRYSVGQVPGYFAMRSVSSEKLRIYRPRLNPKYNEAVAVRQDHILLAVNEWIPGDAALRVDWEMYQALSSAKQGKPIDIQPFHILRRLDLFLRKLGSEGGPAYSIETIEWSNHRTRTVQVMRVDRRNLAYKTI